jgi:hypothetical protein
MSAPLRHTGDRGLRDRRPRRAVRDRRPDVSRWIEAQTGWSTRKFVRTARRHWVIEIQAGGHCITAADPAAQRPAESPNKISNASQDTH